MRNTDSRRKKQNSSVRFLVAIAVLTVLLWFVVLTAARALSGTITVTDSFNSSSLDFAASYSSDGETTAGSCSVSIASDGTISISAEDSSTAGCGNNVSYYETTVILTVTNSDSDTLTVSLSDVDSLTIEAGDGVTVDSDGYYVMTAGSYITLSLASSANSDSDSSSSSSGSAKIAILDCTYISFNSSDYASYTVTDSSGNSTADGTISFDTAIREILVEEEPETAYTLTLDEADIQDGYCFAGWVEGTTGELLSTDLVLEEVTGSEDSTYSIQPAFVPEDTALYYIESAGTDTMYYCLDHAITAAGEDGTIVVYGNDSDTEGTVYGSLGQTEFTIPSGVTLLLPYDQDDLAVGSTSGFADHDNSTLTSSGDSDAALYPEVDNVLNLTVPEGDTITVEGSLVIGGTIQSNSNIPSGATSGAHANLYLNGSLVVGSGGVVSVCGYILGSGSVECQDGSSLYEPFVVLDFLGGNYTQAASGDYLITTLGSNTAYPDSKGEGMMPFLRYTVQNVQTSLSLESGSILYAYADLYANSSHNTATGILVGDSETGGVIILDENASLEAEYDAAEAVSAYPQVGRTSITLSGGASFGSLDLVILDYSFMSYSIDTSYFLFDLPYNYEIILDGSSTYTIENSMAILPGASLTVAEGSTLNIQGDDTVFLVYDGVDDYTSASSSVTYSESHAASSDNDDYPTAAQLQEAGLSRCGTLLVNGRLNIGTDSSAVTFAGLVQTEESYDASAGGPKISVGSDVVLSYTAQLGVASSSYLGRTDYTLTALLVSSTESTASETVEMEMAVSTTYFGVSGTYVDADFTYSFYTSSDSSTSYTLSIEQTISGAWYTQTADYLVEVLAVGTTSGTVYESVLSTAEFYSGDTLSSLMEQFEDATLYSDSGCTTAVESTDTVDSLLEAQISDGTVAEGSTWAILYVPVSEFLIQYEGNGGSFTEADDSGTETEATQYTQYIPLEYTSSITVTLEANAFTNADSNGADLDFEGWAYSSDAASPELEDQWTGPAEELISALQDAYAAQSSASEEEEDAEDDSTDADSTTDSISEGVTVYLYAVWLDTNDKFITFNTIEDAEYTVVDSSGNSTEAGTISFDTVIQNTYDSGVTYTLTLEEEEVPEGYLFAGWVEGSTGELLSSDLVWEGAVGSSLETYSVQPAFVPEDTALYYIESVGTGTMYYCLDSAIVAAGEDGTIVVYGNDSDTEGTVYGSLGQTEFTIPSGVTLLLPYDQDDLTVDSDYGYGNVGYASSTSDTKALVTTTQNVLNLTVPEDTTIQVSGYLVVGGTIQGTSNAISGATSGDHANLYLNGSIVVNDGGILSSFGYILGTGTVSGLEGSHIYEPFIIMDFVGGSYTTSVSFTSSNVTDESNPRYKISPYIRYSVQNVQTTMTLVEGAYLSGCDYFEYSTVGGSSGQVLLLVGDSEDQGIITLAEDASLQSSYDPETYVGNYTQIGRTSIIVSGGAEYVPTTDLDQNYERGIFPIPYNYDITLENGTYEIGASIAILPGATLTVAEDATLNLDTDSDIMGTSYDMVFLVYDGVDDYSCVSTSTSFSSTHEATYSNDDYPTSTQLQAAGLSRCGEFIVNGTLNIGSDDTSETVTFAGLVQTTGTYDPETGTGPVIHVASSDNVDLDYTAQIGYTGSALTRSASGATVYELTALLVSRGSSEETVLNEDGSVESSSTVEAAMVAGTTYYGAGGTYTDEDYSYTLYYSKTKIEDDDGNEVYPSTQYGPEEDTENGIEYSPFADTEQTVYGAWYSHTAEVYSVGILTGTVSSGPADTLYLLSGETMEVVLNNYGDSGLYTDSALSTAVSSTDTIDSIITSEAEAGTITSGSLTALLYTAEAEFALRYNGSGGTYAESGTDEAGSQYTQYISMDDTSETVALEKNQFTYGTFSLQGWGASENTTETILKDEWSGTVAELITILNNAGLTVSSGARVDLYAVWTTEELISVSIEWGSLSYTYGEYRYAWDGSSMQYELQDSEGNAVENGSWEGEDNTITITNDSGSTSAVDATVAFVGSTDLGFSLNMGFALTSENSTTVGFASETDSASISSISAGTTVVMTADLNGTPSGSGTDQTLGTITVTIKKSE